jgi:hypothetical protein
MQNRWNYEGLAKMFAELNLAYYNNNNLTLALDISAVSGFECFPRWMKITAANNSRWNWLNLPQIHLLRALYC